MTVIEFLKLKPAEITQYLQKINFKDSHDLKLSGLLDSRRRRQYKVDKKLYRHRFTRVEYRYAYDDRCRIEISTINSRVVVAILVDTKSLQVIHRCYGYFGNPNLNTIQGKNTSFWSYKRGKWRWEGS